MKLLKNLFDFVFCFTSLWVSHQYCLPASSTLIVHETDEIKTDREVSKGRN